MEKGRKTRHSGVRDEKQVLNIFDKPICEQRRAPDPKSCLFSFQSGKKSQAAKKLTDDTKKKEAKEKGIKESYQASFVESKKVTQKTQEYFQSPAGTFVRSCKTTTTIKKTTPAGFPMQAKRKLSFDDSGSSSSLVSPQKKSKRLFVQQEDKNALHKVQNSNKESRRVILSADDSNDDDNAKMETCSTKKLLSQPMKSNTHSRSKKTQKQDVLKTYDNKINTKPKDEVDVSVWDGLKSSGCRVAAIRTTVGETINSIRKPLHQYTKKPTVKPQIVKSPKVFDISSSNEETLLSPLKHVNANMGKVVDGPYAVAGTSSGYKLTSIKLSDVSICLKRIQPTRRAKETPMEKNSLLDFSSVIIKKDPQPDDSKENKMLETATKYTCSPKPMEIKIETGDSEHNRTVEIQRGVPPSPKPVDSKKLVNHLDLRSNEQAVRETSLDQIKLEPLLAEVVPEEFVDFVIDDDAEEYSSIQNSQITGNVVKVRAAIVKNCVSYMEPNAVQFREAYPGVSGASFDERENTVTGFLKIAPRTLKPFEMTVETQFIYWVVSGTIIVRSTAFEAIGEHNILYGKTLTVGACLLVPVGTPYTIENRSETEDAILGYVLINSSTTSQS